MKYDIKIYRLGEEMETVRDLKESQVKAIVSILSRHGIKTLIKPIVKEEV